MRDDTSFSDKKLTTEEFSKKYWMDGKAPYQYHTATIEDGRDEREQFLFNNVRAIWDAVSLLLKRDNTNMPYLIKKEMKKFISVSICINTLIVIVIVTCQKHTYSYLK